MLKRLLAPLLTLMLLTTFFAIDGHHHNEDVVAPTDFSLRLSRKNQVGVIFFASYINMDNLLL